MRTLVYPRDVRAMPLLLALQAAGVPVRAVRPETDEQGNPRVAIEVDDAADDAAVGAVVAAHDAAALDAAEATDRSQFLTDVANLKAYQTLASPTLAQTAAATKAQNRILRRVVSELRD